MLYYTCRACACAPPSRPSHGQTSKSICKPQSCTPPPPHTHTCRMTASEHACVRMQSICRHKGGVHLLQHGGGGGGRGGTGCAPKPYQLSNECGCAAHPWMTSKYRYAPPPPTSTTTHTWSSSHVIPHAQTLQHTLTQDPTTGTGT
jgi:hypothetical protein